MFLHFSSICKLTVFLRVSFPKFWDDLEGELDEHKEDLLTVKSVLTVMGFTTKSSIVALKSMKSIVDMGLSFTEMTASKDGSDILKQYAALNDVKSFSVGMKTMILQIVNHLKGKAKPKKQTKATVDGDLESIQRKMFEHAQKVRSFFRIVSSYSLYLSESFSPVIFLYLSN